MVESLYNLCLETLVVKSADIEDLSGVPFEPYLLDLLNYLFLDKTSEMALPKYRWRKPWKSISVQNLLGKIADAHSAKLRQPKYAYFGSLRLTVHDDHEYLIEMYPRIISQPGGAPRFITQLDLSMSWFRDEDVPNLKFMVNLMVLDLSATKISDYGVSHLARLAELGSSNNNNDNTRVGLLHLETLSLAYNNNVTDGSLKYLPKMAALCGIDLSTTNVTPQIATNFLKTYNYVCNDETPPLERRAPTPAVANAWHHDPEHSRNSIKEISYRIRRQQRNSMCPVHPLTLITHQAPFPYSKLNPQHQQEHEDERKGVAATFNENMYMLLTNDDCYGRTKYMDHDTKMRFWWTKNNGQLRPLVFTRPSLTATSAEFNLGNKRSFETMANGGAKATQRPSLLVKHSQTAHSFIENFQW